MKEHWDELADLAADVRSVLEHAALRGVTAEPEDEPLPEAIAPDPETEPRRIREPLPSAGAWSALAVKSREAGPGSEILLENVRKDIGDCMRCNLHRDRRSIVFGVGDPNADLVVCGEAPGYHEDQKGEPFVGPAGEMLDKMLVHVLGLSREQAYILNVVKCRPPKNRNPLPDEIATCRPFLGRQLEAIQPKVLLVLGSVALSALFGPEAGGIVKNRGKWRKYQGIDVLPTFHPAYLLRKPEDKRLTFQDLKELKTRYDALGGRR